jgi:hypothetical protein
MNIKGKCDFCENNYEMRAGKHYYCARHYVDTEPEECLYEDMRIIFLSDEKVLIGHSKEVTDHVLEEIKKRYPELYKEAEADFLEKK